MACPPSEDSDQPGNPPNLIRVFAVRMKKAWILSYPFSAQRRLIRLGAHSFCWFCHVVAHLLGTFIAKNIPFQEKKQVNGIKTITRNTVTILRKNDSFFNFMDLVESSNLVQRSHRPDSL